jgi:hypothetical protein
MPQTSELYAPVVHDINRVKWLFNGYGIPFWGEENVLELAVVL